MKKLSFLLLALFTSQCAELQNLKLPIGQALSTEEIGGGLKEALTNGISKGADLLSQVDGYFKSPYKVLLPEEALTVINRLKAVPGFNDLEANLTLRVNRAAELAAQKAKPIFVNAIKQMTFKDATNILMGADTSATSYLRTNTYDALYTEFRPVILNALNEVHAADYWETAVTAYNKIPFVKKTNPKLDDYVTSKALTGLFSMIAKEEIGIRKDVSLRTTDLLKKVFAKQDKK
ncbi:MAG TPA: DUF4197 domain-containing protein [Saprospiraceae bacterium]|nr:DUF4197 domain-containing protein [Saprospiraceae bacterium]HNT21636.1 DUF4197 domain-containing protein [Saprospiraceae bacterium]